MENAIFDLLTSILDLLLRSLVCGEIQRFVCTQVAQLTRTGFTWVCGFIERG